MIKRILVPLDGSKYSNNAIDCACKIAKAYDADVVGLVIIDSEGIKRSLGPIPLGASHFAKELEETKNNESKQHIQSLLDIFIQKCNDYGVTHRVHERQGMPSKFIVEEANYFDLLIIGLRTYYKYDSQGAGTSLEEILKHSITPVLAINEELDLDKLDQPMNYIFCFDGSQPSCRALQRFAQLPLSEKAQIKIIYSSDDHEMAQHHLYEVKAYLKSHGMNNIEKVYTDKDIIEVLEQEYMEWADMIVLGAHSHRSFIDFLYGSFTKYLIKENKKPLFIGF